MTEFIVSKQLLEPTDVNTASTFSFADVKLKGPWADVRAYGAAGDGVTDDSAAIQSAIDALGVGGIVFFPKGTYMCNSLYADSGIIFLGTGWGSILKRNGDPCIFYTNNADKVDIKNLTFDRNEATTTQSSSVGTVINSGGSGIWRIDSCWFNYTSATEGTIFTVADTNSVSGSLALTISNCYMRNVIEGLLTYGVKEFQFTSNYIEGSVYGNFIQISGLGTSGNSDYGRTTISGNTFIGCEAAAIYLYPYGNGVAITGNTFVDNASSVRIKTDSSTPTNTRVLCNIAFTGNSVYNSDFNVHFEIANLVNNGEYLTVSGNTFYTSYVYMQSDFSTNTIYASVCDNVFNSPIEDHKGINAINLNVITVANNSGAGLDATGCNEVSVNNIKSVYGGRIYINACNEVVVSDCVMSRNGSVEYVMTFLDTDKLILTDNIISGDSVQKGIRLLDCWNVTATNNQIYDTTVSSSVEGTTNFLLCKNNLEYGINNGSLYDRVNILSFTASSTNVYYEDLKSIITNNGATGEITINLPTVAGVSGIVAEFACYETQTMNVVCYSGETIRNEVSVFGSMALTDAGDSVRMISTADGAGANWMVLNSNP